MANWLSRIMRRGSSDPDRAYLHANRYPASVLRYFGSRNADEYDEINDVRMYPVADIRVENEGAIPGYVISPMGYLNIASTITGDTYCIDLNVRNAAGEPRVVLATHDEIEEGMTSDQVKTKVLHIAASFADFIGRFRAGDLPSDYYAAKDAGYQP